MKSIFKPVLVAGLLATVGFAAFSQAPMGGDMYAGMGHERMGKMDPARMQTMMERRNADLKAKLKLTPAQEGAWTTYTTAIKLPADMKAHRSDMAEIAKLPTPERIDKMKALHTQRMADMNTLMDKHGDATKTFYATLTPEQKKVFDDSTMRHLGGKDRHHGMRDAKPAAAPKP